MRYIKTVNGSEIQIEVIDPIDEFISSLSNENLAEASLSEFFQFEMPSGEVLTISGSFAAEELMKRAGTYIQPESI